MHADYIQLIRVNSKLRDRKDYSEELKKQVHEAMKKFELEFSAKEIIEHTSEAFKRRPRIEQTDGNRS